MASLKLTVFLMVTLAYASTVHCDDEILDIVKEKVNEAKDNIEITTEKEKGFFDTFKEKVSGYSDKIVEKSKQAYKATADVVSTQYNKLKEKTKDLFDKKPENEEIDGNQSIVHPN